VLSEGDGVEDEAVEDDDEVEAAFEAAGNCTLASRLSKDGDGAKEGEEKDMAGNVTSNPPRLLNGDEATTPGVGVLDDDEAGVDAGIGGGGGVEVPSTRNRFSGRGLRSLPASVITKSGSKTGRGMRWGEVRNRLRTPTKKQETRVGRK
jgi:hypothetical protein